jgi:hypothetical protein
MRALILTTLLLPLAAQHEAGKQLSEALASGRWSSAAEQAYTEMAFANARKACGDSVPAEFWEWLQENDSVRPVVAWATAVEPVAKVYACLNQLRLADDASVSKQPHLAIGFAMAWSGGNGEQPGRRWASWTEGRSPIPTMTESFAWYVEHQRSLLVSPTNVSWQLLAYTALNDVPLDERAWVLQRFRGKKIRQLRDVFGQVPYIDGALDGKPKTLANMVSLGGVCTVNTQYQMSVMRTLGIPATFGGGPGHCWPCWIHGEGRDATFDRSNDLGNANGTLGEWGVPGHVHESDLRLLAKAVAHGSDRLRDAELCAASVRMLGDAAPATAYDALAGTLAKNPYALRGWLTIADRIGAQRVPGKLAVRLLKRLPKLFTDDLHALSRVLAAAIPPQPQPDFEQTIANAWLRTCSDLLEHAELGKTARRNLITFQERTTKPEAAAKMRFQLLQQAQGELALVVADGLARTRLLGGGGGSAFEDTQSGMRLIGFRCSTTEWSGHRVLASIQPLYLDGAKTIAGEVHGEARGDLREITVADGTQLLGIEAISGDLFDGFRLVSAPVRRGKIDRDAVHFGAWIGGSGDGWGTLLGGTGDPIVGIHGRCGGVIDALGLVLRQLR